MHKKSIVLSLLVVFSVGCSDASTISEKELKLAIAEYLSTDALCIWTGYVFPVDISDDYYSQTGTKAFRSLVDAGILQASKLNRAQKTRYELTKEGRLLANSNIPRQSGIEGTRFCPSQVEVVEIVNYTIPGQNASSQMTMVDYRYRISKVAPWGTAAVVRNNRLLEEMIQKNGQLIPGKKLLVKTKNGWKVNRPVY